MSRTAFLFPGQGTRRWAWASGCSSRCLPPAALYDRAAEVLGYGLAKLCFEGPGRRVRLDRLQSAGHVRRESGGPRNRSGPKWPDVVPASKATAGLSLGEYTAMVFAGAIELEAGLRLVQRRGAAMQEAADATPSGMVSILGLERAAVEALCDQAQQGEVLEIANLPFPRQHRHLGQLRRLRASGPRRARTKAP